MAVHTTARQVDPMVHASGSVEPAPLPRATRKPMVGWYDPHQLAQTAVHVAISTIFGRHSDHRLVEAMASGGMTESFYDYTYHYIAKLDFCPFCIAKISNFLWNKPFSPSAMEDMLLL
jgi:hypothetical protein